eukprot:6205217-Pleurochrysis_carterae.AAC.2
MAGELPAGVTEEAVSREIERVLRTANWDEITPKLVLRTLEQTLLPNEPENVLKPHKKLVKQASRMSARCYVWANWTNLVKVASASCTITRRYDKWIADCPPPIADCWSCPVQPSVSVRTLVEGDLPCVLCRLQFTSRADASGHLMHYAFSITPRTVHFSGQASESACSSRWLHLSA